MHIEGHGVSVSSPMSISAVTTSAPPAFPLFITLMAAFTSSMVGGSLQISKSSTVGGISDTCSKILTYLECFQNVPSSVQAFLFLSKEHCHLCLLQGRRCFKAIIYVIKCFNRIGKENIWFSVDMHARKRLSRLFVSNERKNCYRRWRKVPLSPSLVALGASCFPDFKTALDLDHAVNEVFPDQNDVKQHVLILDWFDRK